MPTTVSSGPGSRRPAHDRSPHTRPEPRSTGSSPRWPCRSRSALTLAHRRAVGSEPLQERGQFPLHTDHLACGVELGAQPRDLGVSGIGAGLARLGAPPRRQRRQRPPITLMALFGQQRRIQVLPPQDRTPFRAIGAVILIKDRQLVLHGERTPLRPLRHLRIRHLVHGDRRTPSASTSPISQPRSLRTRPQAQ